jgi:PAS domain S-box-containing protein
MALTGLLDRKFTDVNDAFLSTLGYDKKDIIGKTSAKLGLFVNQVGMESAAEMEQDNERLVNTELQVRHKDGTVLDGLFSGEVISCQGKLHLLTVMIDITGRKQAEAHLRRVYDTVEQQVRERTREIERIHSQMLMHEKMASIGQLAAGIAHELNNPINFVLINGDLSGSSGLSRACETFHA